MMKSTNPFNMQKIQEGLGYNFTSSKGGFSLDIDQPLTQSHPFKVFVSGEDLTVEPGMIRSLIPCLESSSESKLLTNKIQPKIKLTAKSNQYIYIRCGADSKGMFPNPVIGSSNYPVIICSSSPQGDSKDLTHILIASLTYDTSYKVNQMIQTSLYCERHKFSEDLISYYIWRV